MSIFPTDNYEEYQLQRYGNILSPTGATPAKTEDEVKEDEYKREAEWCEMQALIQMEEH